MFALNRLPRHHHPLFASRALRARERRPLLHLDRGAGTSTSTPTATPELLRRSGARPARVADRVRRLEREPRDRLPARGAQRVPAGHRLHAAPGRRPRPRDASAWRSSLIFGARHAGAALRGLAGGLRVLPDDRARLPLLRADPHGDAGRLGRPGPARRRERGGDAAAVRAAVPAGGVRHARALPLEPPRRPWPHDALLRFKQPYLNVPFFFARAALYFVVWSAIALWFRRQSRLQDETGDAAAARAPQPLQRRAADPARDHHHLRRLRLADVARRRTGTRRSSASTSSRAALVSAFAFLSIAAVALRRAGLLPALERPSTCTTSGKLLFAFTVFWAYIALLAVLPDLVRQHPGGDDLVPGAARRAAGSS